MARQLKVSHDFTGDDNTGLGTADTGQVWTNRNGVFRKVAGTARGTNDNDIATIAMPSPSMEVRAQVGAPAPNTFWEVIGRWKAAGQFFFAEADPNGAVHVVQVVNGVFQKIASSPSGTATAAGELGIICETQTSSGGVVGQFFSALWNGTVVAGPVETGVQGAEMGTHAGLRHGAGAAGLVMPYDTFRGYQLDAADTPPVDPPPAVGTNNTVSWNGKNGSTITSPENTYYRATSTLTGNLESESSQFVVAPGVVDVTLTVRRGAGGARAGDLYANLQRADGSYHSTVFLGPLPQMTDAFAAVTGRATIPDVVARMTLVPVYYSAIPGDAMDLQPTVVTQAAGVNPPPPPPGGNAGTGLFLAGDPLIPLERSLA